MCASGVVVVLDCFVCVLDGFVACLDQGIILSAGLREGLESWYTRRSGLF